MYVHKIDGFYKLFNSPPQQHQWGSSCPFPTLCSLLPHRLICSCSSRSSRTTSSNRCFSASRTWFRRSSSWTKREDGTVLCWHAVRKGFSGKGERTQSVQFHHTFDQGRLEAEGWLKNSRHPEVQARLPGTWKSQRHAPCTDQLSRTYSEVQSSLAKLHPTYMYHFQAPTCADTESLDRNATYPGRSALLPIPTGTGKHKLHSYSFHCLISLLLSLC